MILFIINKKNHIEIFLSISSEAVNQKMNISENFCAQNFLCI